MALPGQTTVDRLGQFNYSIPIQPTPGTNGMVPHLTFSYSSSGGDGYVGIGWSVSGLSAITRCPQTYAQDNAAGGVEYNGNDRFCLDGQRLILAGGTWGAGGANGISCVMTYGATGSCYRTEIDSYRRIVFHIGLANCAVSCFDVWTKDGTDYQYGYTANTYGTTTENSYAAVPATGSSSIIRVWALNQVTDTKGNYIDYQYTIYGSEETYGLDYVPHVIQFTGNSNNPYNSILFNYESRPGYYDTYQAGYLIRPQELLTSIYVRTGGTVVRNYVLGYNTAGATNPHNELNSITLCSDSTCTPPSPCTNSSGVPDCIATTSFTWQGSGMEPAPQPESPATGATSGSAVVAGDFNADGLTDLLVQYTGKIGTVECGSAGNIVSGYSSPLR